MQKNQSSADEFGLNAPVRAVSREAEMAKARAERDTIEKLKAADLAIKEQSARKGAATEESDIEAAISGNRTKVDKDKFDQMERDVESAFRELDSFDGPDAMAKFEAWADKKGMPKNHPMRQQLGSATSGSDLKARIASARSKIVNNITMQREMIKQQEGKDADLARAREEMASRERVAAGNNAATIKAASMRGDGADKPLTESQYRAQQDAIVNQIGNAPESQWTKEQQAAVEWRTRIAQDDFRKNMSQDEGYKDAESVLASSKDANRRARADEFLNRKKGEFAMTLPPAVRFRWDVSDKAKPKMITINGQQLEDLGDGRVRDPKTGKTGKIQK